MNLGIPAQAGQIKEYAAIVEPFAGEPHPSDEMCLVGYSFERVRV